MNSKSSKVELTEEQKLLTRRGELKAVLFTYLYGNIIPPGVEWYNAIMNELESISNRLVEIRNQIKSKLTEAISK